jgi:hypothetical protein
MNPEVPLTKNTYPPSVEFKHTYVKLTSEVHCNWNGTNWIIPDENTDWSVDPTQLSVEDFDAIVLKDDVS